MPDKFDELVSSRRLLITSAPTFVVSVLLLLVPAVRRHAWVASVALTAMVAAALCLLALLYWVLVRYRTEIRGFVGRRLRIRVLVLLGAMTALALLTGGFRPHLLITDVVLPQDPSGFELAAQARALLPALKVLFMSAYAEDLMDKRPEAVARDTLLSKPFRPADLARQVRRVIES